MNKSAAKRMKQRSAGKPDIELGKRIRLRRVEQKISQAELGEKLGVSFQQVQKYEKGVNRIAASRLYDIAAALDMPAARFFEGLSVGRSAGVAETRQDFADDILSTPEGSQLVALFASIKSIKVRRRVVELVKALSEEGNEGKRG